MSTNRDLHQRLFEWWRRYGRVLSWRNKTGGVSSSLFTVDKSGDVEVFALREKVFTEYFATEIFRDPYRIVVAEVMLQQTQVDRVKEKYYAWMEKWPTIQEFAKSTQAQVTIEWQGLGYNRRARFLWMLGQEIVKNCNGVWPKTEAELLQLPGIGRYTARAIMSFAFGAQVGVVDVNVKRVYGRVFKLEYLNEKEWFAFADSVLPAELADPWNQALMDFGALICVAKKPKCDVCSVSNICAVNIEAIKEGYRNYAEKLAKTGSASLTTFPNKSKDIVDGKKLKFAETDRYLRGKIINELRVKRLNREDLIEILSTKYTQFNTARITRNIAKLIEEEMIEEKQKQLGLK